LIIAAPAAMAQGLAPNSVAPVAPPEPEAVPDVPGQPAAAPEAPEDNSSRCDNCPPPRKYDSQEVVKTRRDNNYNIKTINTYEMAQPKPAKEEGGIRVRSDVTLVNFVVHRYRVIYAPALVDASEAGESYAPAVHHPRRICRSGRYNRYGSCRPLRVRG
jgi:hypothetical protein